MSTNEVNRKQNGIFTFS